MNAHVKPAQTSNIEAEQALLGALFLTNAGFEEMSAILEPKHFSEPVHGKIFEAMGQVIAAGRSATPITLKTFLPMEESVGPIKLQQYLFNLVSEAMPYGQAKDFALAIREAWDRRQAIGIADEIAAAASSQEGEKAFREALDGLQERFEGLRAERYTDTGNRALGASYIEKLTGTREKGSGGVPIAFSELADVLSEPEFEAGNLYGLLAASGEGKTSFTLQLIRHALEQGHPVQFLSYDQSPDQVVRQMICQKEGIQVRQLRSRDMSEKEMQAELRFANWIDQQPFEMVKCTNQNAAQLCGYARMFQRRHGNGKAPFVVIDHIRRVKPEDRRADPGTQATEICSKLKACAEQVGGAFMILNQRNTSGVRRDNPRPIAEDLFGGEGARMDFDAIAYLYRLKHYHEKRAAIARDGKEKEALSNIFPTEKVTNDIAELGAIKVRYGSPYKKEDIRFEAELTRYVSERVNWRGQEGMF